jgi:hypothetical protein
MSSLLFSSFATRTICRSYDHDNPHGGRVEGLGRPSGPVTRGAEPRLLVLTPILLPLPRRHGLQISSQPFPRFSRFAF